MQEIRRENLKVLVDQLGGVVAVADRCDQSRSYISQLVNGHGSFGEKAARKLEAELGLERGSLDNIDMRPRSRGGIDPEVLEVIVRSVKDALRKADEDWDSKAEARLIADLYEIYVRTGEYPNAGQAVMLASLRSGAA